MKHIGNYVEREQVHAMLDAAKAYSQRDYLIIKLLWTTGVRVSELLNVGGSDIEFDKSIINVLKAKGGKQRRVYVHLGTQALVELRDYICANGVAQDKPIFTIGRQWVHKLIRRYGVIVGRPDIHPHTLRHGFAINSVRHCVDIRRLQQVLGHASIQTTAFYLAFNDRDITDAYANVQF